MRTHRPRALVALIGTLAAALSFSVAQPSPGAAAAAADPKPGLGEVWPMCGEAPDTDDRYCVVSQTKNGSPVVHPDTGVYQRPEIDLIGDGDVRFGVLNYEDGVLMTVPNADGTFQADGDVSPDDVYSITVNTGDIVPRELYGHLRNVEWTTGGNAGAGYTFTMTFQATPFAWLDIGGPIPCTVGSCGDDTTLADWVYDGFVTGYVTDLESSGVPAAERDLRTGFLRAYNAQDAGLYYDYDTNALVIQLANPHLRAPGQVATGSYETFIPYPMLTGLMSVPDPASLTGGSFTVRRSAGGTATAVPFTLTHSTGGVAIKIPDITYSTPTYRIKPKRTAPGAPRLRVVEHLTPRDVQLRFRAPLANGGAPVTSYRARCQRPAGDRVRAAGNGSPLLVRDIGRRTTTCSVRAVNPVGAGPWSAPRSG